MKNLKKSTKSFRCKVGKPLHYSDSAAGHARLD